MKLPSIEEELKLYQSKAIGQIIKFDPSFMEFICWEQHFNKTIRKIELPDNMKVPFLLKMIQPHVLTEIEDRAGFGLTELSNMSYAELAHILQDTFIEVPVHLLWRATFQNRKQNEGESVLGFLRMLEIIIINCDFNNLRETALKIRFVNGLRNPILRCALWKVPELNIDQMLDIAQEMEHYEKLQAMGRIGPLPSIISELLDF